VGKNLKFGDKKIEFINFLGEDTTKKCEEYNKNRTTAKLHSRTTAKLYTPGQMRLSFR
jgi:hypothetical protein